MGQIVETKKRRRYIWMLSALAAVSALLYWEQTALLYVISTLLLAGLLLVVAFADLEGKDRELNQSAETDAAAMTSSNTATGASSLPLADPREIRSRKSVG